ncbi:hypothetical protein T492DRAFT_945937 [Pavlovales sp. CCMP2436]|nr:hypothetical protein T492DRAFT_945937 [Pavlovales sp. CCMP2436]
MRFAFALCRGSTQAVVDTTVLSPTRIIVTRPRHVSECEMSRVEVPDTGGLPPSAGGVVRVRRREPVSPGGLDRTLEFTAISPASNAGPQRDKLPASRAFGAQFRNQQASEPAVPPPPPTALPPVKGLMVARAPLAPLSGNLPMASPSIAVSKDAPESPLRQLAVPKARRPKQKKKVMWGESGDVSNIRLLSPKCETVMLLSDQEDDDDTPSASEILRAARLAIEDDLVVGDITSPFK